MPIDVLDYDAAWPGLADAARAELESALPGVFLAIEHFGSTSVPGLAAKPIIDLMAAAADVDLVALLRDYLRTHPEDAARYAALKRQLAALVRSGDEYTRAKTDLIQELTDAARAERGLPSIPVWVE